MWLWVCTALTSFHILPLHFILPTCTPTSLTLTHRHHILLQQRVTMPADNTEASPPQPLQMSAVHDPLNAIAPMPGTPDPDEDEGPLEAEGLYHHCEEVLDELEQASTGFNLVRQECDSAGAGDQAGLAVQYYDAGRRLDKAKRLWAELWVVLRAAYQRDVMALSEVGEGGQGVANDVSHGEEVTHDKAKELYVSVENENIELRETNLKLLKAKSQLMEEQ